jgi:hypothetical protein
VLAHYDGELAALRTSLRARNVHRLDGIADNSGNDMAKVAAIKTMEGLADASEQLHGANQSRTPGVQIVIVQRNPPPAAFMRRNPERPTIDRVAAPGRTASASVRPTRSVDRPQVRGVILLSRAGSAYRRRPRDLFAHSSLQSSALLLLSPL